MRQLCRAEPINILELSNEFENVDSASLVSAPPLVHDLPLHAGAQEFQQFHSIDLITRLLQGVGALAPLSFLALGAVLG